MTKLLKKGHRGIIAQLCLLDGQESIPFILVDLQYVIPNHSKVFKEMNKDIPPTRYHDRFIHLQLRSVQPNIRPYRHPYPQQSEIENMDQ